MKIKNRFMHWHADKKAQTIILFFGVGLVICLALLLGIPGAWEKALSITDSINGFYKGILSAISFGKL